MTLPPAALPTDNEARSSAIRPGRSFIVQAPAGSGKTELLIQRYLALLATVDHPEEVIAVTFTRKAATEMQQRILAALTAAVSAQAPTTAHAHRTYTLALAVMEKSRQGDWHIIDNPGRLRIQTIDSLCAYLTRQMPVLSQHGGRVKTVEDTGALYEEAAINTLSTILSADFYSDTFQHLLLHLDNDLPRLASLLQDMLGQRDQWSRYLSAAGNRQELQHAIGVLVEERLRQVAALFPQDCVADLLALLDYAAGKLASQGDDTLVPCQGLAALPGSEIGDLAAWQGIADFLLTRKGGWRVQVDKRQGFPSPAENQAEAVLRKEKKAAMKALLLALHEKSELAALLGDVRLLPAPEYSDAEWRAVDGLCELLKIASAELKVLFSTSGESDFIGIAEAAMNALGTPDEPTDLALYLDYQVKHILVDEFQDISVNQFRLVEALVAGWQADDGRTLFLVGDPMQSIYGFREAEVGQFISTFHRRRLGDVALTALRLSCNFRSQPRIIDWINHSFTSVFPAYDDVAVGAVKFSPSTMLEEAPAGMVKVYPYQSGQHAAEAQQTADIIQTIRAEHPADSIALLVRSRRHLGDILPLLRDAGVTYQAIDIDALGEQPYIQDVFALTRAYLYPADRLAWLSVLRAPWCGLPLDDLFTIVHAANSQSTGRSLWHCCQQVLDDEVLEGSARQRLAALVAAFAPVLSNRQRHSVRHSVESIWCRLGGPATLTHAAQLDNVEAFFRLIASLDKAGRIDDIGLLERKTAALYALPDSHGEQNPVQVMTMHKSKGLEFDHVVLPQLGRKPKARQSALLLWMLHPDHSGHAHLLLSPIAPIGRNDQGPGRLYRYLAMIKKRKAEHEAARLLYVAATRARCSLHLLGQAKSVTTSEAEQAYNPPSGSLLAHLWPAVADQFAHVAGEGDQRPPAASPPAAPHCLTRLPANWQLPAIDIPITPRQRRHDHPLDYPELVIHFDWAGETIKHVGTVAHRYLAQISDVPEPRLGGSPALAASIRHGLLQAGVKASEVSRAGELVLTALHNIQTDERGRWLFCRTHTQASNEYALSGMVAGQVMHVVMDRTFIDKAGCRWIIDYKISRHEGDDRESFLDHELDRYRHKMALYARIMAGLEQRPTRLGLYFPLLKGWRCWQFTG